MYKYKYIIYTYIIYKYINKERQDIIFIQPGGKVSLVTPRLQHIAFLFGYKQQLLGSSTDWPFSPN